MPITSLVSGSHSVKPEKEKKISLIQPTTGTSKKKIPKALKLSEVTKPLTQEERQRHLAGAVKRILQTNHSLNAVKIRLICSVAASSTFELRYRKLNVLKFLNIMGIRIKFEFYSNSNHATYTRRYQK